MRDFLHCFTVTFQSTKSMTMHSEKQIKILRRNKPVVFYLNYEQQITKFWQLIVTLNNVMAHWYCITGIPKGRNSSYMFLLPVNNSFPWVKKKCKNSPFWDRIFVWLDTIFEIFLNNFPHFDQTLLNLATYPRV